MTTATTLLVSRVALVKSSAASRGTLAKHRASMDPELVNTLEIVGCYANEHGRTPLHVAATNGDAATVISLLVAGARLSIEDMNGATTLDLATDDTCREILEHHNAVYASVIEDPATVISAIAAHCATLSHSGERMTATTTLSLRAHQLDPFFLWAPPAARPAVFAWARDAFLAQLMINTQSLRDLPEDCAGDVLDFFEMTMTRTEALHIAMHCSSQEAHTWVRAVLTAAATTSVAAEATILLVAAAAKGDFTTVQDCIAKGADVDVGDVTDGCTALIWASEGGYPAIVQLLLDTGAAKDIKDKNGNTALMKASSQGNTAVVQLLLEAGADKETKNKYGETAFLRASRYSHATIVQLLLNLGADKDAEDNTCLTALSWASRNGCTAIVQLLLEAGVDKEVKNKFGATALMFASQWGRTGIVNLLLKAGADKEAKNKNGKTALDYARINHRTEATALLED